MSSTGILKHCSWKWMQLAFLFCLLSQVVRGQEADVRVRSGFVSDSIKIGEQTAYYLSARYPSARTVLFPDSTHVFSPFEYRRKKYFPTTTSEGFSTDSAVYYLSTFEIDRTQYLQLPVYVLQGRDCTVVESSRDSVLITQLVAEVPDSVSVEQLPLKMNTAWQKVAYDLNFWLVVIITVVLIVLVVAVWLLFGKRINKYFRARRLRKNHAVFVGHYDTLLAQLRETFSRPATESALTAWKKYMEALETQPYTKLTTPETLRLIKAPAVSEDLSRIDGAIYGHNTAVVAPLENLKSFADQQFRKKLMEVQNGK